MHPFAHRVALPAALMLSLILSACGGEPLSSAPATTSAPASAPTRAQQAARVNSPAAAATSAPAAAATSAPAATMGGVASAPRPASDAAAIAGASAATPKAASSAGNSVPLPTPNIAPSAPQRPPQPVEPNPFVSVATDRLSTFALDVDTGAYTAARNAILAGQVPPADTVRVEEFLNYFHYDYPAPQQDAFGIYVDSAPAPFAPNTQIVRVGIQGRRIDDAQRKRVALTFVVDASGSMDQPNRLPLVKAALNLLVDELRPTDQVALVVFGSEAHIVLDMTSAEHREQIKAAIDGLSIEGATNMEGGLQLGYQVASRNFMPGATNRVIALSDGQANIGATGPDAIRTTIRGYTVQGVYLTTVGFGMGGYNDQMLEQLADDGNGNYAYVDTIAEARRIFVEQLTGTLQVIAKDAKVQVDFNPNVVARYRLLGYENRAVADNDFRNDTVDAGEIGAGHSVTALYEVVLSEQASGDALTVQMRYADPQSGAVTEQRQPFTTAQFGRDFAQAAPRMRFAVAVASFAEVLRGSGAQHQSLGEVLAIMQGVTPQLANDEDVVQFMHVVQQAQRLAAQ